MQAQDLQDYDYETNADKTTTITHYTGTNAVVGIPSDITGLPVSSIGEQAFMDCIILTSVTIGNGVANIGDHAFFYCPYLTSVTIPGSVTYIGDAAFNGAALTSVTIPGSVTYIGDAAFDGPNLIAITVDAQNSVYSSVNGVLFDKSQTTLIKFPNDLGLTIPSSVSLIGDDAFLGCTKLTSVKIPGGVANIGNSAFDGCTNLPNVVIPGSVTNIEAQAFWDCLSMSSVYFQGNAPAFDVSMLGGPPFLGLATAYYLPLTTGWTTADPGCGVVLWNPLIQTGDGSFGVQNGQFGFNITGTSNIPIVVEACTNLAGPVWTPLQSLTLTNGAYYFSEPFQPGSAAASTASAPNEVACTEIRRSGHRTIGKQFAAQTLAACRPNSAAILHPPCRNASVKGGRVPIHPDRATLDFLRESHGSTESRPTVPHGR